MMSATSTSSNNLIYYYLCSPYQCIEMHILLQFVGLVLQYFALLISAVTNKLYLAFFSWLLSTIHFDEAYHEQRLPALLDCVVVRVSTQLSIRPLTADCCHHKLYAYR